MSKRKPNGVTPQKTGVVFTCNDPLSFNKGNTHGSGVNGVSRGPNRGVTFQNTDGIAPNVPNASKAKDVTMPSKTKSTSGFKLTGSGLKGF
jgi:hypothetical protein